MEKKKRRRKVDTSISGYSYMGVQISQEQLSDLACINSMMRSGSMDDTPVHAIILVLKTLGLIPAKMINDESSSGSDDNADDNFKDCFQRKFGRFKE